MSKNEQKGNETNETYILPSYIDTNQAHESLFKWIEKQNSETFVRDNFFINKMIKKYYGCIGYWFRNKSLNPSHIVIVVPGSNKVPEAITAISKYYNYNKFDDSEKQYTEITISDEEADPIANELLKKQYPALFDEVGNLIENTELLGTFYVAIPIWEGTYNSKYGKEHRFYIDAQTGEVTGDLYNEKSKINKKNSKRLTPKDLEKLEPSADKNVDKISTTKTEKVEATQKKKEEKKKEEPISSSKKKSTPKANEEDNNEEKEIEEDERKRYIAIALIVVCIAVLLFISSKILTPNHDPKQPNPKTTSITATPKPKYTPPPKDKVEKQKVEKETPEKFTDSVIKKLISQKYKDINELMSKNPDETMEIEEYTNITSMFRDLGQLEDYYSKTTSIFPEKTTKVFKSDSDKTLEENKLPDGSAIPEVIKEQAKGENELISVSTSYIETYKDGNSDENATEKKDRTVLIFTLSTEDDKTKIKSVHRKYEQVDESAISQIVEKESNSYSEISQNKSEENKEEKTKQEEKKKEDSYKQPEKKEVEYSTTQKPHINLIPQGSTYVEETEPPKQEVTKKESVEQVETSATQSTTNSNTTNTSLSEGSDSGSAGGSVQ